MTTDEKKLHEAVYIAFAKAGLPIPQKGLVALLVGMASDVYDIGFRDGYIKGVEDERLVHEDWKLGVKE